MISDWHNGLALRFTQDCPKSAEEQSADFREGPLGAEFAEDAVFRTA
jgi:hypothetical protein